MKKAKAGGDGAGIRKKNGNQKKQQKKKKQVHLASSVAEHEGELNNFGAHSGKKSKSLGLLDKMRMRLSGGQFRMLNEVLYTCGGEEAKEYFEKDPDSFKLYHAGYQEQMSRWPKLPVEVVIDWLKSQGPKLTVADFGCGDARLAKSVKNKVFSFDLVSNDPLVTACNMAHTHLGDSSVDVSVFCLSLMGTDYPSYLKEAHRVLKHQGWLLIAEVKSRFDPANNGANPQNFLQCLKSLGFSLVREDSSNKMFILFFLRKTAGQAPSKKNISWPDLKPCLYKRR